MEQVVKKLKEQNKTIATMESCTGGKLASDITSIEGASEVLKFSAVTYCNEFKIKFGVSKETIDTYTVYSMETAREMSKQISLFANSDYGVGITGQINRVDSNNPTDNHNKIYISIFVKEENLYYEKEVTALPLSRKENKEYLSHVVEELLLSLL